MSARLVWFKSSYSDSQGSDCVEVAYNWGKSSYSDSADSDCVEVSTCPHLIHVRDSKLGPRSPRFAISAPAWATFITYTRGV
jgi:hypothetical protein